MTAHTQGKWSAHVDAAHRRVVVRVGMVPLAEMWMTGLPEAERIANANVMAAAPTQHAELLRYLPIIERAEADPELWVRLTEGTGIATANGYRAAIQAATGEPQ